MLAQERRGTGTGEARQFPSGADAPEVRKVSRCTGAGEVRQLSRNSGAGEMKQMYHSAGAGAGVMKTFRRSGASLPGLVLLRHERSHCRDPKVVQQKRGVARVL